MTEHSHLYDLLQTIVSFVPGLLTGVLFMQAIKVFLPLKKGKIRYIAMLAMCTVTVNLVVILGDPVNVLATLPFFVLAVFLCCGGSVPAKLTVCMVFYSLTASVNALIFSLVPSNFKYLFLCYFVIWAALLPILRHFLPSGADLLSFPVRTWALLGSLALMPFLSTLSVIVFTEYTPAGIHPDPFLDLQIIHNFKVIIIVLFCAALTACALIFALVYFARSEQLAKEQALWLATQQYYTNLDQAQQQIRHLRHDMANHFAAMAGLDDDGMRRYLNQLAASPAMYAGRRFTENEIANIVLDIKATAMENSGTPYEFDVKLPAGLDIDDADLSALFANALDNAIEASAKLPAAQRFVKLYAKTAGGIFMLNTENAMDGSLNIENGRLATTKKQKENHGLGVAGMRMIAKKYGGSLEAKAEDGVFYLEVYIPLPQGL